MEYLKNETQLNEEKSSIVVELIKKACEAVHITKAAQVKAQKAYEAIQTNDKNILWRTLQEYLAKYKGKLGDEFEVDDIIFKFINYIELKKEDQDWLFYAECSNLLIKYVEAQNRLIA